MNKEQALQFLKNFIDASIKLGVCGNMESAQNIIIAFKTIVESLKDDNK
jgi:hypothetical protein